jgi:hypothetical protein
MAKPKALPKVTFIWTDVPERRQVRATCKLCRADFWSYSRNGLYPSASTHKRSCPVLTDARNERKRVDLAAQM